MHAVADALARHAVRAPLYKVGGDAADGPPAGGPIAPLDSADVDGVLGGGAVLVGGTAWVFSRPELAGRFDYLFIDEAGQVSLANAVAVGQAARNLVLVGDQMQLAQPSQGSHPGDTGLSCLEYLLFAGTSGDRAGRGPATRPSPDGSSRRRKFEMNEGKLFWDETERLTLLALLLENVGVDRAVRLGDPEVWKAAVRELD